MANYSLAVVFILSLTPENVLFCQQIGLMAGCWCYVQWLQGLKALSLALAGFSASGFAGT